ncbi:putative transposase Ptta/En/Spm plant [Arabidopsis suecica]|uniref:Putative transposase Ptta/En/Spm plant n=1 Tax=Arabidopsis suecica TaxID=45249 RepID=A0A8T2AGA5_ARASU|nr:putative transposase Ptta/En/Spm plant [Arabidopsis suecica]
MDSMDSETQPPDDSPALEDYNMPPPLAPECKSFKCKTQVIDNDGNIEGKMVTCKDVWKFQNSKVIVHFDGESSQPIGDSGGLLGSWIGQLSHDINLLPINYSDWRLSKFWFDDPTLRKGYVMSALGSRCKDVKLRLWNEYKRNSLSETLENRPTSVPEDQWVHLVHMRFAEKWKKNKTGKNPCRAELFIETRMKSDGTFVCEEAKTRAEALRTLMSQNPHSTNNVTTSLDDEFAQVFGPERPGRVRCVGRGPTPSKLVKRSTTSIEEIENSEMVVELKTQVKQLSDQVNGLTTFVQKIIGTSTADQARACATSFTATFANIPYPTFANTLNPTNANQAINDDANANSNAGNSSGDHDQH